MKNREATYLLLTTPSRIKIYNPLKIIYYTRPDWVKMSKVMKHFVWSVEFIYDNDFDLEAIRWLKWFPKKREVWEFDRYYGEMKSRIVEDFSDDFVSFWMHSQMDLKDKYDWIVIKRKIAIKWWWEFFGDSLDKWRYKINPIFLVDSNWVVLQDISKIEKTLENITKTIKEKFKNSNPIKLICWQINMFFSQEKNNLNYNQNYYLKLQYVD
jgi:hypothetical protein